MLLRFLIILCLVLSFHVKNYASPLDSLNILMQKGLYVDALDYAERELMNNDTLGFYFRMNLAQLYMARGEPKKTLTALKGISATGLEQKEKTNYDLAFAVACTQIDSLKGESFELLSNIYNQKSLAMWQTFYYLSSIFPEKFGYERLNEMYLESLKSVKKSEPYGANMVKIGYCEGLAELGHIEGISFCEQLYRLAETEVDKTQISAALAKIHEKYNKLASSNYYLKQTIRHKTAFEEQNEANFLTAKRADSETKYKVSEIEQKTINRTIIGVISTLFASVVVCFYYRRSLRVQKEKDKFQEALIAKTFENVEDWKVFFADFQKIYPDFITKMPKMSDSELKTICYLKAGLNYEEIAEIRGILKKSVYMRIYAFKKKHNINEDFLTYINNIDHL